MSQKKPAQPVKKVEAIVKPPVGNYQSYYEYGLVSGAKMDGSIGFFDQIQITSNKTTTRLLDIDLEGQAKVFNDFDRDRSGLVDTNEL